MNNFRLNIGNRLKKCRKDNHYTQEQLSELLGISQKHYSEAERGITGLSITHLIELSNILSVSLDYLLKGEVLPQNTDSYKDLRKICQLYYDASDTTRKNMLVIMQLLLETEKNAKNKA